MYSELQLDRIRETLAGLDRRVGERFPKSGLCRVSRELVQVAQDCGPTIDRLRLPMVKLRVGTGVGISAVLGLIVAMWIMGHRVSMRVTDISDWLQGSEALLSEVVLVGLAILFFTSLESRFKRRVALASLHQLRSIVHIVDMHQLTKDPEPLLTPRMSTQSSPERTLTRFELVRYLDYCSEMLSLTSKLAALHVQYLRDPVVLNAVNDIETLAAHLSGKIWQKIMILDLAVARQGD